MPICKVQNDLIHVIFDSFLLTTGTMIAAINIVKTIDDSNT